MKNYFRLKQLFVLLLPFVLLASSCARKLEDNQPLCKKEVKSKTKVESFQRETKNDVIQPEEVDEVFSESELSCAEPLPATLSAFRIVIDAGHGGQDGGAKSIVSPFIREKTLTLKTALKVEEFLSSWGYDVRLTRKKDVFVPLLDRVDFAEKCKCTLFVSIHFNSTPKPTKARGIEIYYFGKKKGNKDKAARKMQLRAKRSTELAKHILKKMVAATKSPSRGVHHGNLYVIRETTMPAVLVEGGFLSNQEEAKKLKNPNYLRFLAWSLAKGIDEYAKAIVLGAN